MQFSYSLYKIGRTTTIIVQAHGGKICLEAPKETTTTAAASVILADRLSNDKSNRNNTKNKKQKTSSIFRFSLPIFY
jgi:creatinine amidohydrolase/Fe(II)-dependent formamide hydrolase-like protein